MQETSCTRQLVSSRSCAQDCLVVFQAERGRFNRFSESIQQKADYMVKIKIDYAKCAKEKEKICVELCPFSVFVSANAAFCRRLRTRARLFSGIIAFNPSWVRGPFMSASKAIYS